jgi:type II secretory pathway component PulJ
MQNVKCPYFLLSLVFGGLSVLFALALVPFIAFLGIHLYTRHIKDTLVEHQRLQQIITRIETLERRISFAK